MKKNYLNVGCGSKFDKTWVNIDMTSSSPYVLKHNLLEPFPFNDNNFEVVYHSQVLEHIPRESVHVFLSECYRVLSPGGILRIVVPDLENIATEYLKALSEVSCSKNEKSLANYEWILLELFDQMVRNKSGGQMTDFLRRKDLPNKEFVINRVGYVGDALINSSEILPKKKSFISFAKSLKNLLIHMNTIFQSKTSRVGKFRLGGEVHMWMYDFFSLSCVLEDVGFFDIKRMNPHTSQIPGWSDYQLDVKGDLIYDPSSLFVEARKLLL